MLNEVLLFPSHWADAQKSSTIFKSLDTGEEVPLLITSFPSRKLRQLPVVKESSSSDTGIHWSGTIRTKNLPVDMLVPWSAAVCLKPDFFYPKGNEIHESLRPRGLEGILYKNLPMARSELQSKWLFVHSRLQPETSPETVSGVL